MAQEKTFRCPRCQNPLRANTKQCGKCGARIKFVSKKPSDIVLAEKVNKLDSEFNQSSFRLSSMLLTITLIAVCLALFVAAPGLGITLAVLSFPPFIRTLMVFHA